jgi:PAS domain S-box-containing protein
MRGAGTSKLRKGTDFSRKGKRKDSFRQLEKNHEDLKLQNESLLQAQFELEKSRDRYAEFFDSAPVCFVTLTPSGVIREINIPGVRLLGRRHHQLTGWPFARFIGDTDKRAFLAHLSRCRDNSDPARSMSVELQLARRPDEKSVFIELVSVPMLETGSKKTVFKSVFRDITGVKEMQEVHRWLAAIVESSNDAIIGKDLNGKIISCNRGAERLFGYPCAELIGKSAAFLIPPEFQDEESKTLQRLRESGAIELYETIWRSRDGALIPLSLTISPIRDSRGKLIGVSEIARDVTERKRAEKELAEGLAREQEANRAKDNFLAALSHELRTPLNPVLLLASDSENDPELTPQTRANFQTIRKNIELEARLIDDLLDLTRITRGKLVLNKSELDVHAAVKDAISTVFNEIEQKRIALKLDLHAKNHHIFGDAVRLQQVFWNVLKNAVKFTHEGGQIIVESQIIPGGKLLIRITDTGIGMNPGEMESIFSAFSQGVHHFGGLGLGLAISRALVELHSGSIQASSPGKGKGAAFSIELPLVGLSEKKKATRLPLSPAPTSPAAIRREPARGRHILLVEDHPPTRLALTQLLIQRRYQVTSAASLSEARALMKKTRNFDLLISDIGLPDGSGNDLMSEFQKKFGANGIALTGYGTEQDVAHSQASGFMTHLTKPVRIESLENALAMALKSKTDKIFAKNGMPR